MVNDLREVGRKEYEGPLRIYWIPEKPPNVDELPHRVNRSISYFREWLPRHADHHHVDVAAIQEFYLEMYRLPSHQLRVDSVLVDDRGKELRLSVRF